jgi:hypothetical protein
MDSLPQSILRFLLPVIGGQLMSSFHYTWQYSQSCLQEPCRQKDDDARSQYHHGVERQLEMYRIKTASNYTNVFISSVMAVSDAFCHT